jgi:uncharacterized membrane protein (DUF373 family)
MKKESFLAEIMNYIVSGYVYFVAFTLVVYMVSSLIAGVITMVTGMLDISSSARIILSAPEHLALEHDLLHKIAFTIVLVKAYKILIAYAQTRNISIKYILEMAIVAPTIELVFNVRNYSMEVSILFACFAFANLIAYLFFYKTIKTVNVDFGKEWLERRKE